MKTSVLAWAMMAMLMMAGTAQAEQFEYILEDIPAAEGSTCDSVAQELETRFIEMYATEGTQAFCAVDRGVSYDVLIQYNSEEALNWISTFDSWTGALHDLAGYNTLDACVADISAEAQRFERATGLTPFVSYCLQARSRFDERYILRVDGFGDTDVKSFVDGPTVFTKPTSITWEEISGAFQSALEERGNVVSYITYKSSIGMLTISARYYGTSRIDASVAERIKVDSEEQCNEQLAIADTFLDRVGEEHILAWCGAAFGYEINFMQIGGEPYGLVDGVRRYESYEDCMSDREQAVSDVQRRGTEVFGGLCTFTRGDVLDPREEWLVKVFTNNE